MANPTFPESGSARGGVNAQNNDPNASGTRPDNSVFHPNDRTAESFTGPNGKSQSHGDTFGAAAGAVPPDPRIGTESSSYSMNNSPVANHGVTPAVDRQSTFDNDGDQARDDTANASGTPDDVS